MTYLLISLIDSLNNHGKRVQDNKNNIDHTKDTTHEITVLLPPIDISIEEQRALGYMPLRDDFERVSPVRRHELTSECFHDFFFHEGI